MNLLAGKKGLILGVANNRSIAWACAEECSKQGAELAFNYLGAAQEKRVRELLVNSPEALLVPCDVGNDEEIQQLADAVKKRWGRIDFIVHSVAFADKDALKADYLSTSRSQFAQALDISAFSLVAVCNAFAPLMSNGGSIVSMSYYGAEKVVPRYNVMGVAKAALECSTRYLAEDLGPKGIRVNCISAGPIRTLSSSAISGIKGMLETAEKHAPMRRNVTTSDVGKSCVYLTSDLASGVTGEIHYVDCGYNVLGMFGTP